MSMNEPNIPTNQTTDQAQQWAQVIRNKSSDGGVISVIEAINKQTDMHRANMADVIVSCSQILAQSIAGDASIAAEIRQGIISMIDGYTMQVATDGQ